MTWSKPSVSGKAPPPSRAHSMTLVERRLDGRMQRDLYVFGGGDGPHYFNDVYKFDIGNVVHDFYYIVILICEMKNRYFILVQG